MKKLNPYFFFPFGLTLLLGGILLVSIQKGDIVLIINQLHDESWLDILMKYATYLGDGLFPPLVGLGLLFYKRVYGLFVLLSFALGGLGSIFWKRVVFGKVSRPKTFFTEEIPSELAEQIQLHFVEGVQVVSTYSFPSGHTATAFAWCAALSFLFKNKVWGLLFFFLAILAAFTRIYLVQHFFIDTYFGAIWGVLSAWLVYVLMKRSSSKFLQMT